MFTKFIIIWKATLDPNNSLDVLQKLDTFYNNAWTKLIFVISIGFTIVGIIVPLIINRLQNNLLKQSEAALKRDISDKTKEIKDEISKELLEEMEIKFQEYENQIKITKASANAKLFLAEGRVKLGMNYYDKALSDFISASINCMESENYPLLTDALKLIANDCIPNLSIEEIDDLKTRNYCDLNEFIIELTKIDDRLYFKETIGEIKVTISKLPKKIKDKPIEQSKQPEV